jgi:hypothetical protein
MPVILATLEAEISVDLGKKVVRAHLNRKKLGITAHTCHTSDGRKHKIG